MKIFLIARQNYKNFTFVVLPAPIFFSRALLCYRNTEKPHAEQADLKRISRLVFFLTRDLCDLFEVGMQGRLFAPRHPRCARMTWGFLYLTSSRSSCACRFFSLAVVSSPNFLETALPFLIGELAGEKFCAQFGFLFLGRSAQLPPVPVSCRCLPVAHSVAVA